MAYITIDQVNELQFQPNSAESGRIEALIDRASRMIDKLCEVKDGYFDAAAASASAQSLDGTGTRYLRLPPYVGSIDLSADVAYESGNDLPDCRLKRDELGTYWLIADNGFIWDVEDQINVTARWGFAATPLEIQQAVVELVIAMWRTADPARERAVSDAGGETARAAQIPARVREACKRWAQRQPVAFA